jgi:hypothetical protein
MWEPQPLTTLRASKACRRENFTLPLPLYAGLMCARCPTHFILHRPNICKECKLWSTSLSSFTLGAHVSCFLGQVISPSPITVLYMCLRSLICHVSSICYKTMRQFLLPIFYRPMLHIYCRNEIKCTHFFDHVFFRMFDLRNFLTDYDI